MKDTGASGGLILCPACGKECFVLVRPRYEGFTRTGEDRVCAGCGHCLPGDAPPARRPAAPALFGEEDRGTVPDLFRDDERGRLCRYCAHYVVNPFRQWCALHQRDVAATESCDRFSARAPEPGPEPESGATGGGSECGDERRDPEE